MNEAIKSTMQWFAIIYGGFASAVGISTYRQVRFDPTSADWPEYLVFWYLAIGAVAVIFLSAVLGLSRNWWVFDRSIFLLILACALMIGITAGLLVQPQYHPAPL